MIDTVRFEDEAGKEFRMTDYGLILKSFSAPEPTAKTYRVSIDGMDGDLDMTEWAGVTRYNTRTVEIEVRDMDGFWWQELMSFCHGRNIKITHSQDESHYYFGRIEASHTTRERITDLKLKAVCQPYRMCHNQTIVTRAVTGSGSVMLEAAGRPVTSTATVSAEMILSYEGGERVLTAGTHELSDLVLTRSPVSVAITGTGTITFKWQDGVL